MPILSKNLKLTALVSRKRNFLKVVKSHSLRNDLTGFASAAFTL